MLETLPTARRTPRWSMLLTGALACVLLILALRGVDWREIVTTLQRGRIEWIVLAYTLLSSSYFLRGLRWRVLLSAEHPLRPLHAFWAVAVGYLGNSFLPARAGELIRCALVGRNTRISASYALATTLIERIVDTAFLVLISVAALATLPGLPEWMPIAARVMAAIGAGGVAGLFAVPRLANPIERLLLRVPVSERLRARVLGLMRQALLGMRVVQQPTRALTFLAFTPVIWLIDAFMAVGVAQALELHLALGEALLLLAALGLASAAPSTPGYVGIYQFVAVSVLAPFSFSRSEALAYILTFQAVSYAVVVTWGALGLWRLGRAEGPPDTGASQGEG